MRSRNRTSATPVATGEAVVDSARTPREETVSEVLRRVILELRRDPTTVVLLDQLFHKEDPKAADLFALDRVASEHRSSTSEQIENICAALGATVPDGLPLVGQIDYLAGFEHAVAAIEIQDPLVQRALNAKGATYVERADSFLDEIEALREQIKHVWRGGPTDEALSSRESARGFHAGMQGINNLLDRVGEAVVKAPGASSSGRSKTAPVIDWLDLALGPMLEEPLGFLRTETAPIALELAAARSSLADAEAAETLGPLTERAVDLILDANDGELRKLFPDIQGLVAPATRSGPETSADSAVGRDPTTDSGHEQSVI